MSQSIAHTEFSMSMALDPEEEAFRALRGTICEICRKKDITAKDDPRLQKLVGKYTDRYPQLTAELIEDELQKGYPSSPVANVDVVRRDSAASSALTPFTEADGDDDTVDYGEQIDVDVSAAVNESYETDGKSMTVLKYDLPAEGSGQEDETVRAGAQPEEKSEVKKASCCRDFKETCRQNGGYNLVTYTFLLSAFLILAFVTSVVLTYLNYNHGAYRDWALAGGVTSTSATFRVRGPSSDDGKRREFVVSTNPNLALERDQILNVPVAYGDYEEEEHFVKRIEMTSLDPLTPYYYGITRPKRAPNSALIAGSVGKFTTPAPEGQRMAFTVATGSCALTGSKSSMFEKVLDLDPLMFIHMGDFHYEDLNTLDVNERLEAYDKVMGSDSQRLLYMRTIFSYIWDDHDWLGNNQDSDDKQAATVAKQAYTLGIPHYPLGSSSEDEGDAAKYQAFTIGTIRFIITDLRSESIKSSEYYAGKVYSKGQKEWLFDELSQADNYDFVVWVTTRPWTDPVEVGSDSWGGFVSDRDELSAYIAETIGAGHRNLFVLSGDNHMVAFDDGSSTDYSNQDDYPGGFPLMHSGPMSNYGSGVVDFFKPSTNYFTDGCMAYNSELNYQFSTISFSFPEDDEGCIQVKSYSKDAETVIFEKEMCGEIMRYGTPEQDTCTLKKLSEPTQYIFIAAAALIVLSGLLALWFLGFNGCGVAMRYFGIGVLYYLFTIAAAIAGAFTFGTLGVNMLALSSYVLAQSFVGSLFVGKASFGHCKTRASDKPEVKSLDEGDVEANPKSIEKDDNGDEEESFTHDDTFCNDTPAAQVAPPEAQESAEAVDDTPDEEAAPSEMEGEEPEGETITTKLAIVQCNPKEATDDTPASKVESDDSSSEQKKPSNDIIDKMTSSLKSADSSPVKRAASTPAKQVPDQGVSATVAALTPEKNSNQGTPVSFTDILTSPSSLVTSMRRNQSFREIEERVSKVLTGQVLFPDVEQGGTTDEKNEKDESIEITNPSLTKATDIKVSPTLMSL